MQVLLDEYLASDLAVVNAARVSFNQKSDRMGAKEVGLIGYLMRNKHGTPFEHGYFRFIVEAPIFVAREWFRHRIGSFNEWSGRYSEIESRFFTPEEFRTQVGKPGAYSFEPLEDDDAQLDTAMNDVYEHAADVYRWLLERGVAKEQARLVLPVATYTKWVWSVNPRALMHFLELRTTEHAMREIRDLAKQVEVYFAERMPVTWDAWNASGRIAP